MQFMLDSQVYVESQCRENANITVCLSFEGKHFRATYIQTNLSCSIKFTVEIETNKETQMANIS